MTTDQLVKVFFILLQLIEENLINIPVLKKILIMVMIERITFLSVVVYNKVKDYFTLLNDSGSI